MSPKMSWVIDLVCYNTNETTFLTSGTEITFTNENNGETKTETVGANGVCIFDCANFDSGWTNGDVISFTAGGNDTRGKFIKIKAICKNGDKSQLKFVKTKIEEES